MVKRLPFTWNDKTKVAGTPKVGEHVSVMYTMDKDGKVRATEIHVGARAGQKTRIGSLRRQDS